MGLTKTLSPAPFVKGGLLRGESQGFLLEQTNISPGVAVHFSEGNCYLTLMKVFVFSSFEPLPNFWFDGYCFSGANIIYGSGGAEQFQNSGGRIQPGEDRCYVVVSRKFGKTFVGADFKGYAHLFYYLKGSVWAVSNSLTFLADFLRAKGISLTPDMAQIASWHIRRSFGNQMTSHRTSFREIYLLPSFCQIEISPFGAYVKNREIEDVGNYHDEITRFLSIWVSRIATLLRYEIATIYSDITGGRDSRTVLALLLAGAKAANINIGDRVTFITDLRERFASDSAVARVLAETYGFNLGTRRKQKRSLSSDEAYSQWKSMDVGCYGPIYFPDRVAEGHIVEFGGGGGESHRPFYDQIPVDEFLAHEGKLIPDQWKGEWASSVKESIDLAMASSHRPMHPLIHHYREFRNRFHAGRAQMRLFHWAPLGSKFLQRASDACDLDALQEHQVLYDIMHALQPGLEGYVYDTPDKALTTKNRERLVTPQSLELVSGEMYGNFDRKPLEEKPYNKKNLLARLLDEVDEAVREVPADLFPVGYTKNIRDKLASATELGEFEHAVRGLGAHHLIVAYEALK